MLFHSWLLTVLVPLALGAPVSQERSPPTLTSMDNIANATSPDKLAESGNKILLGSKSRLQGSASTDEYPALSTGVGRKGGNIVNGQEKESGSGLNRTADSTRNNNHMGLNRANKMLSYKYGQHYGDIVGSNITVSDGGTLGESSGGKSSGTPSQGRGGSTASKNEAIGSEDTTIDTTITGNHVELGSAGDTGSGGANTGTTSSSGSMVNGANNPSPNDGTTSSTSKHK